MDCSAYGRSGAPEEGRSQVRAAMGSTVVEFAVFCYVTTSPPTVRGEGIHLASTALGLFDVRRLQYSQVL